MYRNKISIGAILKDEMDYLPEWIAYHLVIGIEHFYIADNKSEDGTSSYLEALEEIGIVTRFYQKTENTKTQLTAYNYIIEKFGKDNKTILFIDGDEFLVFKNCKKRINFKNFKFSFSHCVNTLLKLFNDKSVGGVAINWRLFGSSHKKKKESGLVVERFLYCANKKSERNKQIKTIVNPSKVKKQYVHDATFKKNIKLIGTNKKEIKFSPNTKRTIFFLEEVTIHHYIIKSLEEFKNKKQKRGDAMNPEQRLKNISYFKNNDINEVKVNTMLKYIKSINNKIKEIEKNLTYNNEIKGKIDKCDSNGILGWCFSPTNLNKKLKIKLIINNEEKIIIANKFRKGLLEREIGDGYYGFEYKFEPNLKDGDIVEVFIYANNFKFKKNIFIIEPKRKIIKDKKIFLHIGAGKTGTSALQSNFALNHKILEQYGFFYPIADNQQFAKEFKITSGNGVELAKLLNTELEKEKIKSLLNKYIKESNNKNIILSSEFFEYFNNSSALFLKEFAKLNNYNIIIVYYVRAIGDHFVSAYHQMVKRHGYFDSFENEFTKRENIFLKVINKSIDTFGKENVIIKNYDGVKENIFKDFLKRVLDIKEISSFKVKNKKVNRSLTSYELFFLKKSNKLLSHNSIVESAFISNAFIENIPEVNYNMTISKKDSETIKEKYKNQIDEINKYIATDEKKLQVFDSLKIEEEKNFKFSEFATATLSIITSIIKTIYKQR